MESKEVGLAEARNLALEKLGAEEKAVVDFASRKFAEIKHLVIALSRNAEELEKHQINVGEGNSAYRQIVSTSQKNLSRQLKGISNKLTPPSKIDAASVRAYAPAALKTVTMDLMPYWKNIALARLMLRDEVKAIGANLQELASALDALNRAACSEKFLALSELEKALAEIEKKESELESSLRRRGALETSLKEAEESRESIERGIAAKGLSSEARELESLNSALESLGRRKEEIISRFNSEIAPLEKALKRLHQVSSSSGALSQKEKEILSMLLNSPFSAFVSDPNGAVCKGIFVKAGDLIRNGRIELKGPGKEKKLDAIGALVKKDFFTDCFWETNKVQAETLKAQKALSSLRISAEISALQNEKLSAESEIMRLRGEISAFSQERQVSSLRSLKESASGLFKKAFGPGYALKA